MNVCVCKSILLFHNNITQSVVTIENVGMVVVAKYRGFSSLTPLTLSQAFFSSSSICFIFYEILFTLDHEAFLLLMLALFLLLLFCSVCEKSSLIPSNSWWMPDSRQKLSSSTSFAYFFILYFDVCKHFRVF